MLRSGMFCVGDVACVGQQGEQQRAGRTGLAQGKAHLLQQKRTQGLVRRLTGDGKWGAGAEGLMGDGLKPRMG